MKLKKSIKLPSGTIIPAGTELHFSNEGLGYYNGQEVNIYGIPTHAIAMPANEADGKVKWPKYSDAMPHGGPPKNAPVFKADSEVAKKLGIAGKPWEHIVLCGKLFRTQFLYEPGKDKDADKYANLMPFCGVQAVKFVWDTRKVTEIIDLPGKVGQLVNSIVTTKAAKYADSHAKDSHKPLDGYAYSDDAITDLIVNKYKIHELERKLNAERKAKG